MVKSNSTKTPFSFYAIGVCIPVVFFLLLEVGLRLVGFGQSVPLFVENPANTNYLVTRPDIMKRYFPFTQHPPNVTMEADFFLKDKPENGFRVFVQGGSTAAGFPYGMGGSIAGTLEQRLRQSMPNKHVEVVNTAMSAVNSHTLLDLADDIIQQQPDMILIYAGHNEFLGIMGASSNFATAQSYYLTRLMLQLKNWRLFQLVQYAYAQFETSPTNSTSNQNNNASNSNRNTMMAKVADGQSIEFNSPVYNAGLQQFESNMSALLAKYKKAGIPVFISSIASNVKDQPPFESLPAEPKFENLLMQLRLSLNPKNGKPLNNQELKQIASTLSDSRSALLHFELGKVLMSKNLTALANKHFKLAIQHDLLKFRAPQEINGVIQKIATNHDAFYVDTQTFFSQRSKQGIVGSELMLEHLHPNLQGYYVINEAFYQSISTFKPTIAWQNISIGQAWKERLILPSEEYAGFASVQALMTNYPFVSEPQPLVLPPPADSIQQSGLAYFKKQIGWQQMIEQNLAEYRKSNNKEMIAKTLQMLADALPHNGLYNAQAADAVAKQHPALAKYYEQRAELAGLVNPN